jgi:hypothetical protein
MSLDMTAAHDPQVSLTFRAIADDWSRCLQASSGLPTLDALEAAGVPVHHNGFGLVGVDGDLDDTAQPCPFRFLDAGPDHALHAGHKMIGHRIDEVAHPVHVARLGQLYRQIVKSGAPHSWRSINMARNAPPKSYSRILVPVADNVGDGRRLFGVWIWSPDSGV